MDSRFHIKVEFSAYGQDYKWDASLNWSGEYGQIDRRITEWFIESYEDAYSKSIRRAEKMEAKAKINLEIAELKRLQAKYPNR